MARKKDIYESLNMRLEIDASRMNIQTKQDLIYIMKSGGYHLKGKGVNKKKVNPTEKQLQYAWEHLRQTNLLSFKVSNRYFNESVFHYSWGTRNVRQVKKGETVKIGEKIYKGGQFLPKHKKGD